MGLDFKKIMEDLKSKFEDIPSKIPFLNKKDTEEEDDEQDVTEITEVSGADLSDDEVEGNVEQEISEEEGEEEEEAPSRNVKSLVVKVILILGFIYLVVDEFILKEENIPVKVTQKKQRKKKKLKQKVEKISEKENEAEKVEKKEFPREELQNIKEETAEKIVVAPPVEKIDSEDKKVEAKLDELIEKVDGNIGEVGTVKNKRENEREDKKEEVSNVNDMPSIKEEQLDEQVQRMQVEEGKNVDEERATNLVMGQAKDGTKKDEGKALEPVENLQFNSLGRGLVYNCKEGHWACVGQEEFFACRKNQKWSEVNNKRPECHAVGSYATTRDCRIVQLYNINMAIKTDFCGVKKEID